MNLSLSSGDLKARVCLIENITTVSILFPYNILQYFSNPPSILEDFAQ